ncbi:hypothetical protein SISSUDRAFT_1060674 [Sistotremastrum suecicum HHB10207 ss-3]|uniref:Uncharacterized protein n=1 Tax=Sistotremastrum suecicum HHB10207 ss-3 TaxID=1314776 RepID=A0A166EWC3_9AGAM|nr:hypothetical protein SISSUDRAFT_1060674 [Sistotremastrum suecicum HHB10207 ss-3]
MTSAREKLDVEDEDQRLKRLGESRALERTNESVSTKPEPKTATFDFGDRTTYDIPPPTDLLKRVEAFLPQLEASNALLQQRVEQNPHDVNIEHIDDEDGQYVEMNLGLGVFKQKRTESEGSSSEEVSSSEDSDSDDSEESDNDMKDPNHSPLTKPEARPRKPLPKRAQLIVELPDKNDDTK